MSMTVLASVRGAPGVTTTARLLAGTLASGVIVEADLSGGTLAVRHGLRRTPGLTTFAAARTATPEAWRDHAQLGDGVPVLVGPEAPDLAVALWTNTGVHLAKSLAEADGDIVVDLGRLTGDRSVAALLEHAGTVAVLLRPTVEDLVTFAQRLPALREISSDVGAVLVGLGDYSPSEVAEQLGVQVLGILPAHPRWVELDAGRGAQRAAARNELVRAVRSLANVLVLRAERGAAQITEAGGQPGGRRTEVEVTP